MAWGCLSQLGPTEEANPATDNATNRFELRVETDAISEVAISVRKQAYGEGPEHHGQNPL